MRGDHVISALADPANTVAESDESNNQAQRTVTIKGNKVTNGSFEQSSTGTAPDGWSGSQGTSYDTSGRDRRQPGGQCFGHRRGGITAQPSLDLGAD